MFDSVSARRDWEFIYGASHYLFNKNNSNLPVSPDTIKIFDCISEDDANDIIRKDFVKRAELDFRPCADWKSLAQPLKESFYTQDYVEFAASDETRLVKAANSFLIQAQNFYRCYLSIVKVRLIRMSRGVLQDWHRDQFPTGLHKLLIYLSGASKDIGTTEIKLKGEEIKAVEGRPGVGVLFDTNMIEHRGFGPKSIEHRYSVEFTFAPTFRESSIHSLPTSPYNGFWPKSSEKLLNEAKAVYQMMETQEGYAGIDSKNKLNIQKLNSEKTPRFLQIGGGPKFLQPGWVNVDNEFGESNPHPVNFSVQLNIGVESNSIDFLNLSDKVKYFDQFVFFRVLCEVRRILKKGGLFLIKIPAYEKLLEGIRKGEFNSCFYRSICGIHSSWSVYGVSPTAWQLFSFYLCSAKNSDSKSNFWEVSSIRKSNEYLGPLPNLNDKTIKELSEQLSINELASFLRRRYSDFQQSNKSNWAFYNQNAWSRVDLKTQISVFGFNLVSDSTREILDKFSNVPGFSFTNKDTSYWLLFKKN